MPSLINENTQFLDEVTSKPIVNGYVYIGTQNTDTKLNLITIYPDRGLSGVPLANPIRTGADGRVSSKVWIPGKYSLLVEDASHVQKLSDSDAGTDPLVGNSLLVDALGTNDITAVGAPVVTELVDNQSYILEAPAANTGAMTLKIDALPVYPIKKSHDLDILSGDIKANQKLLLVWSASDSVFEMQTALPITSFSSDIFTTGDANVTGDVDVGGMLRLSKGADIAAASGVLTLGTDGNYFDVSNDQKAIAGATQANPCVLTIVGHGFVTGDMETIKDVVGMTELNGNTYTITVVGTDTVSLDGVDSTAFTAYTSGGVTIPTIYSIASVGEGHQAKLHFDGVIILAHHATDLVLLGNANITTGAGDNADIIEYAVGDWRVNYRQAGLGPNGRGTWNPELWDGFIYANRDPTYSILTVGNYFLIDKMCFCEGFLDINAFGTLITTGDAYIGNLPFPAKAGSFWSANVGFRLNLGTSVAISGVVRGSGVRLYKDKLNGSIEDLKVSEYGSNGSIGFSIMYEVE